jgi:hypothetical protein
VKQRVRQASCGSGRRAPSSTLPFSASARKAHPDFSRGETIHYYELGSVKVGRGNEVLRIWTFANGLPRQRNIAEVVPGATDYPPL